MHFYSNLGISQLILRPDLFARAARLPKVGLAQIPHLDRFANSRFVKDPSGDRKLAPLLDRVRERGDEEDLRYLASRLASILQQKPDFYQSALEEIGLTFTDTPRFGEGISFWLGPIQDHAGAPYAEVVRERLAIGVQFLLEFADAKTLFAIFHGEELLGIMRRPLLSEDGILHIGRERADEPVFIFGQHFPRGPEFKTLDLEWLVNPRVGPTLVEFHEELREGKRHVGSERRALRLGDSFEIGNGFSLRFGLPQYERTVAAVDLGSVTARVTKDAEEATQEKIWATVVADEVEYWLKQIHDILNNRELGTLTEGEFEATLTVAKRELQAALTVAKGFNGFEERFPGRLREWEERLSSLKTTVEREWIPAPIAFAPTPLASPVAMTAKGFQLISSEDGTVHPFELPEEGSPIHIGRERIGPTHLILLDRRVSASHAQISRGKGGGIKITDLGSRNGTYVGAKRLPRLGSEVITTSGVRVRFGLLPPFELRFSPETEARDISLEIALLSQAEIPTHVLPAAQRNPGVSSQASEIPEEELLLSPWRLWLRHLAFWRWSFWP